MSEFPSHEEMPCYEIDEIGAEPRISQDKNGRWHVLMPGWQFSHSTGGVFAFEEGGDFSFDTSDDVTLEQMETGWIKVCGYSLAELRAIALGEKRSTEEKP